MTRIKVAIVDDSLAIRQLLTKVLQKDPLIEVIGVAEDAYAARELIRIKKPDVITLDVEMPGMNGITFLKNLMRLHPMPVVMVSSLTGKGSEAALEALEHGAVDVLAKPNLVNAEEVDRWGEDVIDRVKSAASSVPAKARTKSAVNYCLPTHLVNKAHQLKRMISPTGIKRIIAIGGSTGGPEAVRVLMDHCFHEETSLLITLHVPDGFSVRMAERLTAKTSWKVCEAEDGMEMVAGHAYLAPGGKHLRVRKFGARALCHLDDAPARNNHRPSVDVLFESAAAAFGASCFGVLLTGMGADGAEGLLKLHKSGAITICQDEASSIVWGMPGAAVSMGASDATLPLDKMGNALKQLVKTSLMPPRNELASPAVN